ncbi:hypothetical protein BDN72DRAFT_906649 [Pluteus cervinus]|uniref:Uncharacterized protein n=1 Tax=Pluteus cervinus TaxID=181527 RepID=A0ACD2ZYL3_9AGAR|nr:hypothetical protein BDN72DRAFT_906649 [Pluteus cervinus]
MLPPSRYGSPLGFNPKNAASPSRVSISPSPSEENPRRTLPPSRYGSPLGFNPQNAASPSGVSISPSTSDENPRHSLPPSRYGPSGINLHGAASLSGVSVSSSLTGKRPHPIPPPPNTFPALDPQDAALSSRMSTSTSHVHKASPQVLPSPEFVLPTSHSRISIPFDPSATYSINYLGGKATRPLSRVSVPLPSKPDFPALSEPGLGGTFDGLPQGQEFSSGEASESPLGDADNRFHYKTITSLMQRMTEGSSRRQAAIRDHFLAMNTTGQEIFLALQTTTDFLQLNAQQQKDMLDLLATYNGMSSAPTRGVDRHDTAPSPHLDSFRAAGDDYEDTKEPETPESNERRRKYLRKIQDHIAFLLGIKRGEIATVKRKLSPTAIRSVIAGRRELGLTTWCLDWDGDAKSGYNTMAIQVAAENFVDLAKNTWTDPLPNYATDLDQVVKSMQQHVHHLLQTYREKGSLYAAIDAKKPGSSLISGSSAVGPSPLAGPSILPIPTAKPPTSSSMAGPSTSKTPTSSFLTASPRTSHSLTSKPFGSPFSMNPLSLTAGSSIPGQSGIKPLSTTETSTGTNPSSSAEDVILQHIGQKKVMARRTRKQTLARHRRELVDSTDLLQHHSPMMKRLGTEAMSSDESEPEYFTNELAIQGGRTKRLKANQPGPDRKKNHYTVVQPAWRSFQLSKFLWRLDELRQESRVRVDGPIVRMPRGNPPRIRIRTSQVHDKKAPKDLPCNFYDPAWLKKMNDTTRSVTVGKMQTYYDLNIPGDPSTGNEGDS